MSEPSNLTAWERWELASFDADRKPLASKAAPADKTSPAVRLPTATEIEQMHQQVREEGFRLGKEEGYRAGHAEGEAKTGAAAQHLARATETLERSLADLDSVVADELLTLAIEIARAVVRQEIGARPETLLGVVREALAQLPHQHAAIYLHPDDASLLRSFSGDQLTHAGHRIHEDPKLARGDCILEAGGTQIDATVATRWRRVIEGLGISDAWSGTATAAATLISDEP